MWSYSAARTEPASRAEAAGVFALMSLWLVYTRFFATLQAAHVTLPACPFYTLTGHPCPFCGATRAYAAMWRGDVGAAVRYHPLGPLFFVATFVAAGCAVWALIRGRRLRVAIPPAAWVFGAALLAVSWSLKVFWLGN